MERPYQEYYWDKRELHKRTPAEIKDWLKKLPCGYCGSLGRCYCTRKDAPKRPQRLDQTSGAVTV